MEVHDVCIVIFTSSGIHSHPHQVNDLDYGNFYAVLQSQNTNNKTPTQKHLILILKSPPKYKQNRA